jgi:hypothetical protein
MYKRLDLCDTVISSTISLDSLGLSNFRFVSFSEILKIFALCQKCIHFERNVFVNSTFLIKYIEYKTRCPHDL